MQKVRPAEADRTLYAACRASVPMPGPGAQVLFRGLWESTAMLLRTFTDTVHDSGLQPVHS